MIFNIFINITFLTQWVNAVKNWQKINYTYHMRTGKKNKKTEPIILTKHFHFSAHFCMNIVLYILLLSWCFAAKMFCLFWILKIWKINKWIFLKFIKHTAVKWSIHSNLKRFNQKLFRYDKHLNEFHIKQ